MSRRKVELSVSSQELRARYEAGASLDSLAAALGVSAGTVRNRLVEAGTSFRRGRPGVVLAVSLEELARRHADGASMEELAADVLISPHTLAKRMQEAKIRLRLGRRPRRPECVCMKGCGEMGEVQRALEVTGERAADASRRMSGGVGALTLAETSQVLGALCAVLEPVWEMAGLLSDRVAEIADRELPERRGDGARVAVEAAGLHLRVGREAVMAGFHLHELGRVVLAQVADQQAADQPVEVEAADGDGDECGEP